jgi:hypothetical protein
MVPKVPEGLTAVLLFGSGAANFRAAELAASRDPLAASCATQ